MLITSDPMKKQQIAFLLITVFLISCEKYSMPTEYPSTYTKIGAAALARRQTDYTSRNQFIETSLNEFGFCDMNGDLLLRSMPPYKGDIPETEAINAVKSFISENKVETGLSSIDNLNFNKFTKDVGYGGSVYWHLRSENQKVDTVEVLYTQIMFHLTNGKVTLCYGNYFPEIYVPGKFNFSQTKAKSILKGRVLSHYSIAGEEYKFTISEKDLDNCTFHLKIMPKEYDDKIELRVVWQIYVPNLFYQIYVDVMSGEIVSQEPTIIS